MTRNLRTQLVDQAEAALHCWHGDDMTREQATALLPSWRHAAGLDDDMRADVLSRFPTAEPPAVPFVDYFPDDVDAVLASLDVPAPVKDLGQPQPHRWDEASDACAGCANPWPCAPSQAPPPGTYQAGDGSLFIAPQTDAEVQS